MASVGTKTDAVAIRRRIGAKWLTSYAYHEYIDPAHMNWNKVNPSKIALRISYFNSNKHFLEEWLRDVLAMNEKLMDCHSDVLELPAIKVKGMAREVLAKIF